MTNKETEGLQPTVTAKKNPRNNATMFQILQNVQFNVVQHKKYVKEMTKLYKKLDEDSFRESFKNALLYLFTFGDTSANVDRVIQFVATFTTCLDDEEDFLQFICNIIFDCQCVSGQSVRYRASQLLAAVLSALGDDASLDDNLCDKLLESQLERISDTRGAVRCRAALALQRLQNPNDPDDKVTRSYRFHMSCDPSSSVRRAIVMSIAKCSRNVPFVLERLCDTDEAVRRAAFLYISAISVTQIKVRQRVLTLKVGLNERSPRVRRVVEEILIPAWLSTFQGDIIKLLKAIRLDNAQDAKDSQYVAGKLLESLFKRLQISELLEWLPTDKELRLIPAEKLNKETAWYWRHLVLHLQAIDDDETLATVLPDLVILTGYIRAIVESPCPSETTDPVGFSTRHQVLHELGCMLSVYDAADTTGRMALQTLITDILTGDYGPLNTEVIRAFVSVLELVILDMSARMEVVSSLICALRDPPEPDMPSPPPVPIECDKLKIQKAKLRVSLNVAIEAQEDAVSNQDFKLAEECKAKVEHIKRKLDDLNAQFAPPPPPPPKSTIREKKSDTETLIKCLTILNSALDTPQIKTVTPMMKMIFNELEVEIFRNPDIIEAALQTVALYGMLDKEFAKENKAFFFAHMMHMSNEPIVTTVLQCILDILCVHGVKVFADDDGETSSQDKSKSKRSLFRSDSTNDDDSSLFESMLSPADDHNTIIMLLLRCMDDNCPAYRLTVVEGLCRLLYLGHLESPSILSRLILLWFNPATADEDMLRQTIGVFFQTFPATVDGAQEQIQKATLPTLRALANAPSSSPLAEIDQEAVVKFLVSLTRVSHELTDSQGAMAMLLCSYLVRRPSSTEAGLACRMLALLSAPRDVQLAVSLANMLRDLCLKLPDKQSCRNLTRFLGALEVTERSLNKMSTIGVSEGTIQAEDTVPSLGRTTSSLPQPLARSTHVVINETVEEEVEVDETSPTDVISRISEGPSQEEDSSSKSLEKSSESDTAIPQDIPSESSSGVSPVKKAKVTKGKKKKLSLNKQMSAEASKKPGRKTKNEKGGDTQESEKVGVKRSRSQRSLVDVERAQKSKAEKENIAKGVVEDTTEDVSNVTIRRSTRSSPPKSNGATVGAKKKNNKNKDKVPERRSTRSSTSSKRSSSSPASLFEDSGEDTMLHTIVYDKEMEQSLLNDSSELVDFKQVSKANVTIPETPDGSEESDSEPEQPPPPKGKRNQKKK